MNPEQIEWLRGWAAKNDCKLDIQGAVGFGRPCVGILTEALVGGHYVSYAWYGMEGDEKVNREVSHLVSSFAPEDAYHKDECLAVLGEGFHALEQLYEWVKKIDEAGLTTEIVTEADLGPGTTTITELMTGRRARIRRLCRA